MSKRYRAVLFGHRRTRWYPTRDEALDAAVKRGWASRDEYVPGRIYREPGLEIEERSD